MLKSFAEDNGIEDAIYYFGEALRKQVVDVEAYLKARYFRPQNERNMSNVVCGIQNAISISSDLITESHGVGIGTVP